MEFISRVRKVAGSMVVTVPKIANAQVGEVYQISMKPIQKEAQKDEHTPTE